MKEDVIPHVEDRYANLPMVLHVRTVNGFGGGPEKTILNSPRYLPPLGYQSVCAYLHPQDDPGIEILKARAVTATATILPMVDRGPRDLRVIAQLVRECKQRNVRIWHAHDDKTNALGILVRRFWPMKLVTTAHGWGADLGIHPWKSWLYRTCSQLCLRRYHAAVAVSRDLEELLRHWKTARGNVHLIENAIDTDAFRRSLSIDDARAELRLSAKGVVLAALGRLAPEKGFAELIDAVAVARNRGFELSLWIGGEGDLRPALEERIRSHQLETYVRLLGHLSDPRIMLQAADVFILSSLREGLPNVVLEAMALETPVIATRVAGVPHVINDREHGLLTEVGNQPQMVEAICRLSGDSSLRLQLATNARRRIESQYDFGIRMQKIARVYDQVLGGKR
jgi:glycosyltransferase involved in cell wall biosynthesis